MPSKSRLPPTLGDIFKSGKPAFPESHAEQVSHVSRENEVNPVEHSAHGRRLSDGQQVQHGKEVFHGKAAIRVKPAEEVTPVLDEIPAPTKKITVEISESLASVLYDYMYTMRQDMKIVVADALQKYFTLHKGNIEKAPAEWIDRIMRRGKRYG